MQSIETWRPIAGYEGIYEVSDAGRVRGVDRIDGQGRRWPSRILRPAQDGGGYLTVGLWRECRPKAGRIHRLVLQTFKGPRPDGMEACHNDGDQSNNALANLRWDTHSANIRDTITHGTQYALTITHCPRGHLLTDPNLVASTKRKGGRQCLACERARADARRAGGVRPDQARADHHYQLLIAQ